MAIAAMMEVEDDCVNNNCKRWLRKWWLKDGKDDGG